MPAYLVFLCQEVSDRKELETYWSKIGKTLKGHEIRALSAYMSFEILENSDGARVEGVTVHEFPSVEAAKAWYNSDAYREIRENHRLKGAKYLGLLMEGGLAAPEDRMPQTKK